METYRPPGVVDGELVDLAEVMPRPLDNPPALRQVCACGKDGTAYAHGAVGERRPFTCAEVLDIRARIGGA